MTDQLLRLLLRLIQTQTLSMLAKSYGLLPKVLARIPMQSFDFRSSVSGDLETQLKPEGRFSHIHIRIAPAQAPAHPHLHD